MSKRPDWERWEREKLGIYGLEEMTAMTLQERIDQFFDRKGAFADREYSVATVDLVEACEVEIKRIMANHNERVAQLTAHRACIAAEHDPANGKTHGDCVVCGVSWPCEVANERKPT